MKFKLAKADLIGALGIASIVSPRPITPTGGAGYLFMVKDGRCYIYPGGDKLHDARVDIPAEAEGEGACIFPADKIGSIEHHRGDSIEFEAGYDKEDDRHWVKYRTELGASSEWSTYNPKLILPFDDALEKAKATEQEFPSAILQEAIAMAKPYLAKPNDSRVPKSFHSMQLFDSSKPEWAKGDGTLFASDQLRACWVEIEAFKGKGLGIHGQHLPFITGFLAKCTGTIRIREGASKTYIIADHGDGQRVLGWAKHVEQHNKFAKWPEKLDTHILRVEKEHLLSALRGARAALDKRRDTIRVVYKTAAEQTGKPGLMFLLSEGAGRAVSDLVDVEPVTVDGAGNKGASEGFAYNVSVNHLLDLVDPIKAHRFNLRFAIVPPSDKRKEVQFFRTIDEFWMDDTGKVVVPEDPQKDTTIQCRVTRFTPARTS